MSADGRASSRATGSRRLARTVPMLTLGRSGSFSQAPGSGLPPGSECAECVDIGSILRHLEAHRKMALSAEVVDLVRRHLAQDASQVRRVGQVTIMQEQARVWFVRILADAVNAARVEKQGAPLDAVHLIALLEQELSHITSVLAGDAADECPFHRLFPPSFRQYSNLGAAHLTYFL